MANLKRDLKGHVSRAQDGIAGRSGKKAPRTDYAPVEPFLEVTPVQTSALRILRDYCDNHKGPVKHTDVEVPFRTWRVLDRKGLLDRQGRLSRSGMRVLAREMERP